MITIRDSPEYQAKRSPDPSLGFSLAVSSKRRVFSRIKRWGHTRRIKACMKQIVGGAFCGLSQATLEDNIVALLLQESAAFTDDPRASRAHNAAKLESVVERILHEVRSLLSDRVDCFLGILAENIFLRRTRLKWNLLTNNCQDFCNSLLASAKRLPHYSIQTSCPKVRDKSVYTIISSELRLPPKELCSTANHLKIRRTVWFDRGILAQVSLRTP